MSFLTHLPLFLQEKFELFKKNAEGTRAFLTCSRYYCVIHDPQPRDMGKLGLTPLTGLFSQEKFELFKNST
jgi:hypothetical protein